MAFLLCSNPLTTSLRSHALSPPPPCFPSTSAAASSVLLMRPVSFQPNRFNGVRLQNPPFAQLLIVKAAAVADGTGGTDGNDLQPPSDEKKEVVPVDKLPLESKLQERLEQKMKMKLAKKIRLRRKRLVRKRHMRKKGRWPPSKMKKLKNV